MPSLATDDPVGIFPERWKPIGQEVFQIPENSGANGVTRFMMGGRFQAAAQSFNTIFLPEGKVLSVRFSLKPEGLVESVWGGFRIGFFEQEHGQFTGFYYVIGTGEKGSIAIFPANSVPQIFNSGDAGPAGRALTGFAKGGLNPGVVYAVQLQLERQSESMVHAAISISDGRQSAELRASVPLHKDQGLNLFALGTGATALEFSVAGVTTHWRASESYRTSARKWEPSEQLQASEERESEIKEMVAAAFAEGGRLGIGKPVSNREFWDRFRMAPNSAGIIKEAESLLQESWVPFTREQFRGFFDMDRSSPEVTGPLDARPKRLGILTLAECIENQGRFLPAIESMLTGLSEEGTWVARTMSWDQIDAWDAGDAQVIDLYAAMLGADIATTLYWLAPNLSVQVTDAVDAALRRNLINPFLRIVEGKCKGHRFPWHIRNNNWNSVCLYGVASATAAVPLPESIRSRLLGGIERSIRFFLRSYQDDGFYEEGVGYWNYGFSRFLVVHELLWIATNSGIDLMKDPHALNVAAFPLIVELEPGVRASFSDDQPGAKLNPYVEAYVRKLFGLDYNAKMLSPVSLKIENQLYQPGMFSGTPQAPITVRQMPVPICPLRQWMPSGELAIFRPGDSSAGISAYVKFGDNGTHHNHNDIGTFGISLNGEMPLFDLGAMIYDDNTFGRNRYALEIHNSFGHAVPVVDNRLQGFGTSFKAKILEKSFSDEIDWIVADLSKAYVSNILKELTRTFVYDRRGNGSVMISDRVAFLEPGSFETALTTFGFIEKRGENQSVIYDKKQAVLVTVDTGGLPFRWTTYEIPQPLRIGRIGTRIGIQLEDKVTEAAIHMKIEPLMEN